MGIPVEFVSSVHTALTVRERWQVVAGVCLAAGAGSAGRHGAIAAIRHTAAGARHDGRQHGAMAARIRLRHALVCSPTFHVSGGVVGCLGGRPLAGNAATGRRSVVAIIMSSAMPVYQFGLTRLS